MTRFLCRDGIIAALPADLRDTPITFYDQTDSTNLRAKQAAMDGAPHGSFYIASTQSAGRGRMGRSFFSPPGTGLYMSLLLRPGADAHTNLATIYAGVAVCRAIERLTGLDTGLKWVNDVFVGGKKVCGILAEAVSDASGLLAIVVGIGINIRTPDGGFPAKIAQVAGALDADISPNALADAVMSELLAYDALGFDGDALEYYRARSILTGKTVRCTLRGEPVSGEVLGISDDGALIIKNAAGSIELLSSGEATIGSAGI